MTGRTQRANALCTVGTLPDVRFHDFRHNRATLLTKGVHPKIVSELLGHSSVSSAIDIYSYVVPGLGHAAAVAMKNLLS